jgi:cytochrome c oxidase cbb3-type subunit 3
MRQWLLTVAVLFAGASVTHAQSPTPKPLDHPTPQDLEGGAKAYAVYCSRCHGPDGSGGMGPPLARPRLRHAADEAAVIGILVEGIPGTAMMAAWSLSEKEVQQVAAYVRSLGRRPVEALPGDPARGRNVYARVGCSNCHIVRGEGSGLGPELTDVGGMRGAAFLHESLVDPGAARPERAVPYEPYGYPAYVIVRAEPRSGPEVRGLRVNEDAFTIQLRDQEGRVHSLQKADLRRLQAEPGTSLMPSYRDTLSGGDLNDLVAYLMTLQAER